MVKAIPGSLPGYLLLALAYLALLWLLPFFPSQDGPSHIYNLAILHDLLNGGNEWGDAFSYRLMPVPNLGFHLAAYPLLAVVSPQIAERIFISLYLILMTATVPFFLKSFGKPPLPLSYLVFPVLFNFPLLMGFYSFSVGVPLFLIGFCLAWRLRDLPPLRKAACLNLAGGALYCCHMIPFLMFISSQIAVALARASCDRKGMRKAALETLLIAPLILAVAAYLLQSETAPIRDISYLFSLWRLVPLATDLLSFSTVTFHRWQIVAAVPLMLLVLAAALEALKDVRRKRANGEGAAPGERALFFLAVMLLCLYLLAPSRFGEGGFFNQRLPWVILIVLLPLLQLPGTPFFRRFGGAALAGCAWFFLLVNGVILGQQSGEVKRFLAGMGAVPKGSCILTFKKRTRETRTDPLVHASSYYALGNGCVDVGNYEAQIPFFPIRFKEEFPEVPPLEEIESNPSVIDWNRFPHIGYLLGWRVSDSDAMRLSGNFDVFLSRDDLTLWKRK